MAKLDQFWLDEKGRYYALIEMDNGTKILLKDLSKGISSETITKQSRAKKKNGGNGPGFKIPGFVKPLYRFMRGRFPGLRLPFLLFIGCLIIWALIRGWFF